MISVTHLRNGATFEQEGDPYRVIQYAHTHMSRGGGTIRVKIKNLHTGAVLSRAFHSGAYVQEMVVERQVVQFLYRDGDELVFMDPRSFEQLTVLREVVGAQANFLREGEEAGLFFWEGPKGREVLEVDLPPKVTMKIVDTAPGVKGDTAANVYKTATLENGMAVKVPLFVKEGELVRVDTRTGEYVERA